LLLAWAARKGVTLILYSGSHASANLQALRQPLNFELMARIDALFVHPGEAGAEEQSSRPIPSAAISRESPSARLYAAVPEPIAWHILDTLMGNAEVRAMFERVVQSALERRTEGEPLRNLVLRIMRLVTHLQVLSRSRQAMFRDQSWTDLLLGLFSTVAERIGSGDIEKLYAWTQHEYDEIGGALHAPGHLLETAPEAGLAVPDAELAMAPERAFQILSEIEQAHPELEATTEYDPDVLWNLARGRVAEGQKEIFLQQLWLQGYIIISEEKALHVFAAFVQTGKGVAVEQKYDAMAVWDFAKSTGVPSSQKPRFLEILRAKGHIK
jgi:hypothetical protein